MAVRIVSDFWSNYNENKDLITRCFKFLLNKYPNPDGEMDAYNSLLSDMFRLNVFAKFSRKRLVAQKLKIDKKSADDAVQDSDITDEAMARMGINVEKKFEQYLFVWIEHCLQDRYDRRRKQGARFVTNCTIIECPPRSFSEVRANFQESPWAQGASEELALEKHIEKVDRIGLTRDYPTYKDASAYVGSKIDSPLEDVLHNDLVSKFMVSMQPGKEKQVAELIMKGYAQSEIADVIQCSSQYVGMLLKRVRERFNMLMEEKVLV
jgi:DNA-directed RNA polymerase specialized sigma24 family protein